MGWLPIDENTPRDGSRIVCWAPGWSCPMFMVWKTNNRYDPPRQYFGDPEEMDDYEFTEPGGGPTHWYPIGPTGKFPHGKLDPTDEGQLTIAITREGDTVRIDFGKKIDWIAMSAAEARGLASVLASRAAESYGR